MAPLQDKASNDYSNEDQKQRCNDGGMDWTTN